MQYTKKLLLEIVLQHTRSIHMWHFWFVIIFSAIVKAFFFSLISLCSVFFFLCHGQDFYLFLYVIVALQSDLVRIIPLRHYFSILWHYVSNYEVILFWSGLVCYQVAFFYKVVSYISSSSDCLFLYSRGRPRLDSCLWKGRFCQRAFGCPPTRELFVLAWNSTVATAILKLSDVSLTEPCHFLLLRYRRRSNAERFSAVTVADLMAD